MTTLVFSKQQWRIIKERIIEEYGDRIFLISWKLKRELGFTVREHMYYDEYRQRIYDIRLDFDDPALRTYFQLKYL